MGKPGNMGKLSNVGKLGNVGKTGDMGKPASCTYKVMWANEVSGQMR